MQLIRVERRKRAGKAFVYSFVLIMACSLMAAAVPQSGTAAPDKGRLLAPTAITLSRFDLYNFRDEAMFVWQSGYEVDNLGYNIYREQGGVRVRLNPALIAGSALQVGANVALRAGNTYAWRGKFAGRQDADARYYLESVDINGRSKLYGPIHTQTGDEQAARPASSKLLTDYSVEPANAQQREYPATISSAAARASRSSSKPQVSSSGQDSPELDKQWELAAQVGVKLLVNRDGWQKVNRAELLAAGLDANASLANLQLYLNGVEQAMVVNADGSIEFDGQSLNAVSTDTRVYWLVAGASAGKRVAVSSAGQFDPNAQGGSFPSTVERKDRTIRFAALLNGPGENFFGPVVNSAEMRQTLQVTALDPMGAPAQLDVAVQGLTLQSHQVRVQVNGTEVGFISYDGREDGMGHFTVPATLLRENKNAITLNGIAAGSDVSLMDFVRLTYPRRYEAASNRLLFSVAGGQAVKVNGFASSNIRVLDITDTANVKELTVSPQAGASGFAFTLPAAPAARTLLAYSGANGFEHPQQVLRNEPSTLHLATNSANMLIITHADFRQSLEPLRTLRESQGLQVTVADVEDVYDEFSFGTHTPQALKDFLQLAHNQWQTAPHYLLLVGDGTSDPRNYLGQGALDLVPTMMVDSTYSEAASDDTLADFDNDGLAEMAVGRLPVTTAQDTTLIVNKIMTYEQASAGDTKVRGAAMVSDGPDAYDFVAFTNQVRASLPADMNVLMINRADGDTQTVRTQILNAINQGPGVVNYLGHGSVGVWSGAGLLTVPDAQLFTNLQHPSIFVMMTCLNGSFIEVGTDSLGEAIIKAPGGGAVAVWASSGLTIPYGQVDISKRFYELLFTGQSARLGDAAKDAKLQTGDPDIRRLSIFFGDPAMRFR
ncbi:MAG TPA: C25 family cysteine peptidase [Pyrinomonadaceae bacterium]|jgi:hypothetical protein